MSTFNKYRAQIGDRVTVSLKSGKRFDMTISQKNDPVAMGLADYRGPQIVAHIRPGGYSINLDSAEVINVEAVEA